MDQRTNKILFALLRSAICGTKLKEEEKSIYLPNLLPDLLKISSKHDVEHLLVLGLKENGLISEDDEETEKYIYNAVYRYEQLKYEYKNLCAALERAQIPFMPLKGAIIREYYPQPWMRTSCDIDILVHRDDLETAIDYLSKNLGYVEKERATHDVSLYSPSGVHVELHFDLVEEGRANNAIGVLRSVWDNARLLENSKYQYGMTDEFFYFYHIAHMAKHFENGGCGIRPFIDLWILNHIKNMDKSSRDDLLLAGGLFKFANISTTLSEVWFGGKQMDDISLQMQEFLIDGGIYGSTDNRVALQQKKNSGRIGYILSRVFAPYDKLKRYYPVLEKHRWLTPVMQIRRWFMLCNPVVAKRTQRELSANKNLSKKKAEEMNAFLEHIGLN